VWVCVCVCVCLSKWHRAADEKKVGFLPSGRVGSQHMADSCPETSHWTEQVCKRERGGRERKKSEGERVSKYTKIRYKDKRKRDK